MDLDRARSLQEASDLLRVLISDLSPTQRAAILGFAVGQDRHEIAASRGVCVSAVWLAKKRGLEKLRKRLHHLGIRSTADLL